MEDVSRHSDLFGLSQFSKTFFGFVLLISYICGTLGKITIFKHIFKFRISERPINILILMDEIIYLTLMTFTTFNLLIVLIAEQTPTYFIKYHLFLIVNEDVSIKIMLKIKKKLFIYFYFLLYAINY